MVFTPVRLPRREILHKLLEYDLPRCREKKCYMHCQNTTMPAIPSLDLNESVSREKQHITSGAHRLPHLSPTHPRYPHCVRLVHSAAKSPQSFVQTTRSSVHQTAPPQVCGPTHNIFACTVPQPRRCSAWCRTQIKRRLDGTWTRFLALTLLAEL